jgi:uncharacterized protein
MNLTPARDIIERHPFRFAAALAATVAVLHQLLHAILDALVSDVSVINTGIISGSVLSLLGGATISRLGLWRELGLISRPARVRTLLWFLPFVIYGLLPLTAVTAVGVEQLVTAAAFGFSTALWKVMALGLLLHALLPRGARTGSALTAALWAGMHGLGLLVGALVMPTLVLVLSYVFLSFAFAAVRLRTGLLWPLIGSYGLLLTSASLLETHGASNLAGSVEDLVPALGLSVLLAAHGAAALPRGRALAGRRIGTPATTAPSRPSALSAPGASR